MNEIAKIALEMAIRSHGESGTGEEVVEVARLYYNFLMGLAEVPTREAA